MNPSNAICMLMALRSLQFSSIYEKYDDRCQSLQMLNIVIASFIESDSKNYRILSCEPTKATHR